MVFLDRRHKKIENIMLYIQLDERLFKDRDDNFITHVATT
jgi:hypothetical protein